MDLEGKRIDFVGDTEVWDVGPEDFLGQASKDCWAYWDGLRSGKPAPFEKDFDLVDLSQHIQSIALLEWLDSKLRIKFCGNWLASFFDVDPTGRYLDDLPNSEVSIERQVRSRDEVLPFIVRAPFHLAQKDYVNYESINLPLLDEAHKARVNFVCFSFRGEENPLI